MYSWYNTVLLETPEVQEPMRPGSEDERKMAQTPFTSVEPRKFTVVKDVVEDLKASIPHNLFKAATVH